MTYKEACLLRDQIRADDKHIAVTVPRGSAVYRAIIVTTIHDGKHENPAKIRELRSWADWLDYKEEKTDVLRAEKVNRLKELVKPMFLAICYEEPKGESVNA